MNVYYYFLRTLYSFTYKYINILQILSESKLHLLQNLYLEHFHKSSKRDDKSRNPSDRNIPDSHIAPPSSPLSPRKNERKERESRRIGVGAR